MAIVEVKVPQLSESVSEATMLQWKKKPGEAVAQDEILIEIETDKVVLEVPAPSAGVLAQVIANDGDTVTADQVIAKIDTDGKSEDKRIEVVGTNSPFTVETFGKPRRIVVDPSDRVLKNSRDVKLRSSILRGQSMVQQGDFAGALAEYKKALDVNTNSSLAHYRIAEVFFQQRNYQSAANAYREALNGDGDPRWTEVWSHIQLGKIFDITGQRERATNEYRQAIQTNDNTQGAMDEARRYLQKAYEQQKQEKNG